MSDKSVQGVEPVLFGEKLAGSQAFAALFKEGMALVEETASYLDGQGRQDSKQLERAAALAYATESMRLTTRLMQLASWLLLHRAVKEGEMSLAQANKEKTKVKLSLGDRADTDTMALLPETLRELFDPARTPPEVQEMQRIMTMVARSYSLRGGTREILRGIIARQLGLR